MSAKNEIMTRIAAAGMEPVPMPDIKLSGGESRGEAAERFAASVERAGGSVLFAEAGSDVKALAAELYPCHGECGPESGGGWVEIVRGRFGVAENGAVWIADEPERRLIFAAANLVIIVPASAIVPTMHEAFREPRFGFDRFGCFVSGPSKTADIEQALVIGAHGARSVTVVVER